MKRRRRVDPMMFLYATLIIPYLAALGRRALPARVRAPWRKA
jgi:hypothetical protein